MNEIRGVSLRPVLRSDWPLIALLLNDPSRAHLWGQRRVCDEEQLLETWRAWSQQRIGAKFVIVRRGQGVGLVFDYERALEDGHTKVVALLIDHPATRGAGPIATALFVEWLVANVPLRKVCFDVFGFNASVIRMLRRLGVNQDMQRREHRYWNGRYWDQFGFAVAREEVPALLQRFTRRAAISRAGRSHSPESPQASCAVPELHDQTNDAALNALLCG